MMHNGFGSGFGHMSNWLCGPGVFSPGPFGLIINLFFWGLLIYLVIKLFQFLFSGGKRTTATYLDGLKERYARGDINEDEYRRMKTELS